MKNLTSPLLCNFMVAFSFALLFTSNSFSQSLERDSYEIYLDAEQPHLVKVNAQLTLTEPILRMSSFGPLPEQWPKYVQQLEVKDDKGNILPIDFQDSIRWTLPNNMAGRQVQLSYRLAVTHEEDAWPGGIDGVAFVRPWGVMLSGRSLFVLNGKAKKNLKVQFHLPKEWKLSTPWREIENSVTSYTVSNQTTLQESFVFAGTHEEVVIPKGDFKLKFVLGGDAVLETKDTFVKNAQSVLDYYIDLMGGNPIPSPGNELHTAMVILNESENMDGEVIGNHLSMFINPKGDIQTQLMGWFMFAHEFFHLWNGKTLRYQNSQTDWFKEGISNYYTIKALNQVGVINEEATTQVLDFLFYQRYTKDPGFGKLAPADAASGFDKDNHWGLIYGGGLFSGICMDLQIRMDTQNTKSLDDVMRNLYLRFGGNKETISQEILWEELNTISETDFTSFLKDHIKGNLPVPITEYLKLAGIEASVENHHLVIRHTEIKTPMMEALWGGFLGNH